jgi:hypothetical protein
MIQLLVDRAISSVEAFESRATAWDFLATRTDFLATQWALDLRRPNDRITNILVLREFEAPVVPILVEPGLEIDELYEHEVAAALSLGGSGARDFSPHERTITAEHLVFDAHSIHNSGHRDVERVVDRWPTYWTVEKHEGAPSDVARELDPRSEEDPAQLACASKHHEDEEEAKNQAVDD